MWFTGQSGYYGRLDPATAQVKVWPAPRGGGPYGIATTASGDVYFASLAGNYIARVDVDSGVATVIDPPTKGQGARRLWPDSRGRIWVSYWNTGQVGMYDPAARTWREWKLPGNAHAYALWVDAQDKVWLSDWSRNAIVRFDPVTEKFDSFPSNRDRANVRQMLGRSGEVWGAESGTDRLVRVPGDDERLTLGVPWRRKAPAGRTSRRRLLLPPHFAQHRAHRPRRARSSFALRDKDEPQSGGEPRAGPDRNAPFLQGRAPRRRGYSRRSRTAGTRFRITVVGRDHLHGRHATRLKQLHRKAIRARRRGENPRALVEQTITPACTLAAGDRLRRMRADAAASRGR